MSLLGESSEGRRNRPIWPMKFMYAITPLTEPLELMTSRISAPKQAIQITTYDELTQWVRGFASGHLNLVILIGGAGLSKSQTVKQTIGKQGCWIEGNATAFGIYQSLWQHRDRPLVIDDVDSLYSDKSAVRLLKCVCQTDEVKTVSWNTAALQSDIPRSFETRSKAIIIANDWKSLNANTSAVEDRGHLLVFEPSREEIHLKVAEWFDDQEVFDWMADHIHLIPNLSMRHYVRAKELKAAKLDWVKVILSDSIPEKALVISRLIADPRFTEQRQRVAEFTRLGYGNATTFYKWLKRIRPNNIDTSRLKITLPQVSVARRASAA